MTYQALTNSLNSEQNSQKFETENDNFVGQKVIEESLTSLLNGNFDDIPHGSCNITTLIKKIANQQSETARKQLGRTVDLSVTASKSVSGIAEMTREISDVDNQTQGIAAAVEELSASVSSIADSADNATREVGRVTENAAAGLQSAMSAQETMDEIADAVRQSADKVDGLSAASEEIGKIVKDIDDIAKQTNLLALNATIEAARAGEAGKGFAVVASEVKSLATQTGVATENIRTRIENLRTEMSEIIEAMNQGNQKVQDGKEVISTSTTEMEGISAQVDVVNVCMEEINGILSQQGQASREVSSGVANIAHRTASNVTKINQVIEVLENTEGPIVDSVNELVSRGGKAAVIYAAKSDHMIWMRKLSQMLAGRAALNPEELADHHGCRLGKWYDNQTDPDFTSLSEWRELVNPHSEVHQKGIEAARLYRQGDLEGAIAAVKKADSASKEVMALLDKIGDKLS